MTTKQDKLNNYYLFTQVTETFEHLVEAESEEEAERLFYADIKKYYGEGMLNACPGADCRELSTEECLNFKGYWDEPVKWLETETSCDLEDTYVQFSTLVDEVHVPQLYDYGIRLSANDEGTAWEGFDLWCEETLTSLCWVPFKTQPSKKEMAAYLVDYILDMGSSLPCSDPGQGSKWPPGTGYTVQKYAQALKDMEVQDETITR